MKKIEDLIKDIKTKKIVGQTNRQVSSICFDSRKVTLNSLFVAQKGTHANGHDFIPTATQKGATCIVLENMPSQLYPNVTYIQVENASDALGWIASAFYDYPSSKIKLIGITGTNGKTTTVVLLHELFSKLGYSVGMLSTIENKIKQNIIPSTHTTPDAITLNQLIAKMVDAGCEYCFMEVSSHAIEQHRISGLHFSGAIFSNITHDHLDYHKTFKNYIYAKKKFFDKLPKDAFALTNMDDPNGMLMLQNTKAKKHTYGLQSGMVDFKAKIMEYAFHGMLLQIDNNEVWFRLTGDFNAYNILVVYATSRLLGAEKEDTLQKMSDLMPAQGRFSVVEGKDKKIAIVDYAHTPDALENVLQTIDKIRNDNQRIITVVGCGGDRDKSKRAQMAKIAFQKSDLLIFTSDNPRTESPYEILKDMLEGIDNKEDENLIMMEDRHQAIKVSVRLAKPEDIILIAGKGHEKYQEIQGVKCPFDDMEVVKKYLN